MAAEGTRDRLSVVIVTFNSADVILPCLDSLFAAEDADRLDVIVVDNDSTDATRDLVADWAARAGQKLATVDAVGNGFAPEGSLGRLTLVRSGRNGGYAFGVNTGIRLSRARGKAAGYWVLNPDCVVPPKTPGVYLARLAAGPAGLVGGRCLLLENPDQIQTDGGRVHPKTGVCSSVNAGRTLATADAAPRPHFASGANFVASRGFVDAVGPMEEDYFLYYEEVDWAFRRGDQPLEVLTDAVVLHMGGSSIGSPTIHRRASAFSNYVGHRSRIMFVRRFAPASLPVAYGWTIAKAAQTLLKDGREPALGILAGAFGLAPPRSIRAKVEALRLQD